MRKIHRYAAAMLSCLGLMACDEGEPLAKLAAGPEAVCVSPDTLSQLKTMVFDSARKSHRDDPLLLNDLERASDLKMDMPLLKQHDAALDRSICTGRVRLVLPTGSGPSFDGERELLADVEYSAQPAADRSGIVYQIEGIEPVVQSLAFADLSLWTRTIARAEPAPVAVAPAAASEVVDAMPQTPPLDGAAEPVRYVGRPSFSCSRPVTFAEQAICQSPDLSADDVRMASLYRAARRADLGEMRLREMQDEQKAWLNQRDACRSSACLEAAYETRISALDY